MMEHWFMSTDSIINYQKALSTLKPILVQVLRPLTILLYILFFIHSHLIRQLLLLEILFSYLQNQPLLQESKILEVHWALQEYIRARLEHLMFQIQSNLIQPPES